MAVRGHVSAMLAVWSSLVLVLRQWPGGISMLGRVSLVLLPLLGRASAVMAGVVVPELLILLLLARGRGRVVLVARCSSMGETSALAVGESGLGLRRRRRRAGD